MSARSSSTKLRMPPDPVPRPKGFTFHPGKRLFRFYDPRRCRWNQGRTYGPIPDQRFDHHLGPKGPSHPESVWYSATRLVGAVAEVFGRDGVLDRSCSFRVCRVELTASFEVVDLCAVGPLRLGLDQRICSTLDYKLTQAWAQALYSAYPDFVGIRWSGRMSGSENVILNDRADLGTLNLISDHDISTGAVWGRIARASRSCGNIVIVG